MKDGFLELLAQTNPYPFQIKISRAEGSRLYDENDKSYIDLISGVAVNNFGHRHPKVVEAIKNQVDKYLHVMVYGEFVQDESLEMARLLTDLLPDQLNCVYPVNSGTEANEAAIKLCKGQTKRREIISMAGAYHGSTNGSLSLSSNPIKKIKFEPLLPDVNHIRLNNFEDLDKITERTAGVFMETIQGDAGVRIPDKNYLVALKKRCQEVGALLVFDEIQCGIGRTARNFAFEHFDVVPDILTLGKALGGGLPIGALVSSRELLQTFTNDPALGHITTFGGNPVVAAASRATLEVLKSLSLIEVEEKAAYLESRLRLPAVKEIRRMGMMFAIDLENEDIVTRVVKSCLDKGLLTFWFLSHPYSFRLSPPLNISWEDLINAADLLEEVLADLR